MAMFPSMSVPPECVNLCKVSTKKGGSWVRPWYECSVLSCAWKVPRVLTGSLASTTHPCHTDGINRLQTRSWLRDGNHITWRVEEASSKRRSNPSAKSMLSLSKMYEPNLLVDMTWALHCCFSNLDSYDATDPESLWESLKPSISYLAPDELHRVYDALKVAFDAHNGQKRRSGEPFIIHPVEVARILGELELDWESIAAGLLHDTVEDTVVVTFDRIEKEFGRTVRNIVEGETKVSKLGKIQRKGESSSKQDVKADDLRQMFLAMTDEVRVIIVKLADRLHNMRTLLHMPAHKQRAIAEETLEVFAPLAKLLGMYQIKSELEYLSFMYAQPSDFHDLNKRVEEYYEHHEKELQEAKRVLKEKIEQDQYLKSVITEIEVLSAYKEIYSIYKSMLESDSSESEVNEMAQLRIVIKPRTPEPSCSAQQVCYHVLGLVHGIWKPVPRAVKDYIATPKPNGYESLHTVVLPFLKESTFRLEVQIRTEKMDLIAERGIATNYSGNGKANTRIDLWIGWLNAIREWQEEFVGTLSSREFVDTVTRDLLGSRVYVFTPKGEIKNLPKGATVIDYAYRIHTEIGNKMVEAKVNGNPVDPKHVLTNAEVVEIITSNEKSNKSDFERHKLWLHHAKTRSARHKIVKFLKEQAALSAPEITADRVENFVADLKEEEKVNQMISNNPDRERRSIWEEILSIEGYVNVKMQECAHKNDFLHINGSKNGFPRMGKVDSIKLNGSASVKLDALAEFKQLEIWKASKIATWHIAEGKQIKWLCVICVDRKGMMSEVTSELTASGITICSCVAEIDRYQRFGAMLFRFQGSDDNLVKACSSIDLKNGIIKWSVGCSWGSPLDDHSYL